MTISLNTMYVIPFPGVVGSGIPANLALGCQRIAELQETTKLDNVGICISLQEIFKQLGGFCPFTDEQLNWNSELLRYINGDIPFLNELLLRKLSTMYRHADFFETEDSNKIKAIPFDFWTQS